MFRRHARCCVLALLPLFLAGCVEGQVGDFVKYDKDADAFHLVQYYTNLYATDPKDLDHIAAVWKKKNAMISSPIDGAIFSTYALERLSKNEYQPVSLGEPDKKPPAKKTKADLESVKIIPGDFYLNKHGNLACFHQVIVPGKVVDTLLDEFRPEVFAEIAKEADRQIKLADKTEKVRKLSWEDVRKELLRQLTKQGEPPPKEEVENQWPLEMESLQKLAKAGASGTGKLSRRGDAFTIFLPLTAKDTKELVALADTARSTVTKQIKEGKLVEEGVDELLESLQVQGVDGGLTVTIHTGKFAHAFVHDLDPPSDPNKQKGYQTTVAGVQGRGIVLSNDAALRKLAKEYGVRLKEKAK